MALIETATKYILDLLTENEELKKFPKEFVTESAKWVKSWFLTPEDPKATAKLEDPQKPIEVKKDIIEDKLAELKNNPVFVQELTAQLTAYAADTALGNPIKSSEIPIILIQINTARFGYTF